jgi:hypothetical protein
MVEENRLNATKEQYAQALHDAGWIPEDDPAAAVAFVRTLKESELEESGTYRMGRILRSYRTGEGVLESSYQQVLRAGELGYFNEQGQLVVRGACLNVIYPERRVAVLPAAEERPPAAAVPAPAAAEKVRTDTQFNPAPPPFPPPPREVVVPVSRSVP